MKADEASRLKALRDLEILDTAAEDVFDDLARIASSLCATPIALVSLVDDTRQWFKARVGLQVSETPREVAFCAHAIQGDDLFVVNDALDDLRFRDNPLVVAGPRIRFYAGAPLHVADGYIVGTLCVIDRVPRVLTDLQRDSLLALRRQVETQLALRQAIVRLTAASERERRYVQFFVHDLRNAIAVVSLNAATLAEDLAIGEHSKEIANDIVETAGTLRTMVDDLLDVARDEEGRGIRVAPSRIDLAALVQGLRRTFAHRAHEKDVELRFVGDTSLADFNGDQNLVRRVLENLIDNAIRHAPAGSGVHVTLEVTTDKLHLIVEDEGAGVPEADRETVFEQFAQGEAMSSGSNGLGLAFCRAAARAMSGTIAIESSARGCRFSVFLPSARSVGAVDSSPGMNGRD